MPDLSARTVPEHRLTVAELLGLMVADGLVEKADADALIALFGQPRLDRREGAARVLQFTGRDCTLDAYLYPPRERAEQIVTHVDARRGSDGADMDADQCVAALRRR